jgi:hypothetical protein
MERDSALGRESTEELVDLSNRLRERVTETGRTTSANREPLAAAAGQIDPDQRHSILIHSGSDRQREAVAAWIADAVDRGKRCTTAATSAMARTP